jgi:CBS domain-containing protein
MVYTVLVRTAIAVDTGRLRHPAAPAMLPEEEGCRARDIMSRRVLSVTPETTAEEISKLLVVHRISGVPVVDDKKRVIGVVSESDIIFSEIHREEHLLEKLGEIILPKPARERPPAGNTAAEIMTSPAITAFGESPLRDLIQLITDKKIKRVVIVDREGGPIGIVSRIDIVKALEHITD